MIKHVILLILLALLISAPKPQDPSFMAGAAIRVITPENLIPISGGMGMPVMPVGKKGDLFVRVLVLQKGDTRLAIVGIDNLGWPSQLGDQSRELIKGIPPENILIGVTHTHSAPEAYGFTDEFGNTGADMEYLDWCVRQIAEAVNEAIENLEPASLKTAVGQAYGQIAFNAYAPDLYDPRMGVIQTIATTGINKGKTIATLVNYASHPEILGTRRRVISPDFCGPLYDRIESAAGGVSIFMNGALGGMVTADNRNQAGDELSDYWNECVRIGNLMGDEALRIIESAPVQENPEIFITSREIRFPIDSRDMKHVYLTSPVVNRDGAIQNVDEVTTRINLLNVGQAQIITVPGEALPNIGFYIRRNMKSEQTFLFGLTNDAFGYLLTKEDFDSFRRYRYITRTSLGEMTGDIYIREVLKLIDESPAPSK
jgi:hypothetical protein